MERAMMVMVRKKQCLMMVAVERLEENQGDPQSHFAPGSCHATPRCAG